jgi:shikimate 5-dehydrogenase
MFIAQGARQFEIWTGHMAPIDVMRRKVVECLMKTL